MGYFEDTNQFVLCPRISNTGTQTPNSWKSTHKTQRKEKDLSELFETTGNF
jgi:hypothetical protein